MDLHEQLRKETFDRQRRDATLAWLQARYADTMAGTDFENRCRQAIERRDELLKDLNREDPLELYEVEGRGVGVVWPEGLPGRAWVWNGPGWAEAPGLVNKSWLEGVRMTPATFAAEFPGAELAGLEAIARLALGWPFSDRGDVLTPPAADIPDKALIDAGYALTRVFLRQNPSPLAEIAPRVAQALGLSLPTVATYLAGWYNMAAQEHHSSEGLDSPYQVSQELPKLIDQSLEAEARKDAGDSSVTYADSYDRYDLELREAVGRFAKMRCAAVANKVRYHLRRMPASGIFDRDDHRTLWDEYSLQLQQGPDELESAWSATVDPMIDFQIERLPDEDRVLITMSHLWFATYDLTDPPYDLIFKDAIRIEVLRALQRLAEEHPQDWVTG